MSARGAKIERGGVRPSLETKSISSLRPPPFCPLHVSTAPPCKYAYCCRTLGYLFALPHRSRNIQTHVVIGVYLETATCDAGVRGVFGEM